VACSKRATRVALLPVVGGSGVGVGVGAAAHTSASSACQVSNCSCCMFVERKGCIRYYARDFLCCPRASMRSKQAIDGAPQRHF